jgi:Fur family ferric uptake transcriptional regulator
VRFFSLEVSVVSLPAVAVSQTPESRFREFLASRPEPRRFTTQHRELVQHIFERHKHFDTKELLEDLKNAGKNVSRPTVYRTLALLVDAGLLRRIEIGQRTVYDHDYGYPSHDHMLCEDCGTMIEFQNPRLDEVLQEVAAANQFHADRRTLVIRGICGDCNQARAAKRRLVM